MNNSQKGASSNVMYIVVAILLLVGGLVLFSRMNSTEAPTQDKVAVEESAPGKSDSEIAGDTESGSESAGKDEDDDDEVEVIEVEAGPFYFKPAEIRVDKGDKVKIVLKNAKGMHDWVVDEFNARTKIINGGETDSVEFVASKTGTFEYYCSVGNHRAQGMVGKLIVE